MKLKKCTKLTLKTQGKARNIANEMAQKSGVPFDYYFCKSCKGWHVGRSNKIQMKVKKEKILNENSAALGIDPGKTGSMALVCGLHLEVYDYTNTLAAQRILSRLNRKFSIKFCVLEKVWFRSKEHDPKRTEVLIRNAQMWETLLVVNKIDYERYAPETWRKGLVSISGRKERFTRKAIKLFPLYENEFFRHDRSEATLMAYRAWRHIEAGKQTRISA